MSCNSQNNQSDQAEDENSVIELESTFFRSLLGKLEDPVFVKNSNHQWIFANKAFEDLIGFNNLIGKTDADLLPPDQVEKFYEGDNQVIRSQTSITQEEQIGEGCYALVKKIPIMLPDNTHGLFGIIFDISDYRKVQLEVEKLKLAKIQSRTDPLTGLANRRYLEEHFTELLNHNQSTGTTIGLLHIDLDYFKEINDSKGHLQGDAVLNHIAITLRSCVRENDFIARIGGDEFVIVTEGRNQSELEAMATRIIDEAEKPIELENDSCAISVSIGVATDTTAKLTLNQMLRFADLALYRAKHNGRGRFEQFNSEIQQAHDEIRRKAEEFRKALDAGQIIPYYQPQFDAKTLEVTGIEALARWNHPDRGIVPPAEFLDIAISERRMVDLDRAILSAVMHDAQALYQTVTKAPMLSINVSPQSLATADFIETIQKLEPFPTRVCFELVESMLLDEPTGIISENLEGLRRIGVSVDIDDFGSGHTSLLGILEAKPDRVKIDKRLVIPMIESKKHYDLVKTIVLMAESIGLDTVAEGVESEAHRELLRDMGCQSIQGFGFARPMSFTDLQSLLLQQAAA